MKNNTLSTSQTIRTQEPQKPNIRGNNTDKINHKNVITKYLATTETIETTITTLTIVTVGSVGKP